jgi:hypothetical protein
MSPDSDEDSPDNERECADDRRTHITGARFSKPSIEEGLG